MRYYFPLSIFCITLLASCSPRYTYFTQSLYEKQNWSQEDIQRIQFYVSRDSVLTRAVSDGETEITAGKIRIINGRKVRPSVIKARTPGVVVLRPQEDRCA